MLRNPENDLTKSREILPVLGENIKKARESKSYNLQQLGKECGYDRVWLSLLEHGEHDIRFKSLNKLAKVLDISLPRLFSRDFSLSDKYKEKNYLENYTRNLKDTVKSKGMKLDHLNYLTGINPSSISKLANSSKHMQLRQPNPLVTTLYALAKASSADVSAWLDN